jgi:hypothetical protein
LLHVTTGEQEENGMRKFLIVLTLGVLVFMVSGTSKAQVAKNAPDAQYEVLNPWTEADPIPVRGISPRLETVAGKKIGLFANFKRAARPMAASVEKRLKGMYPDITTVLFDSRAPNVTETETNNKAKFQAWAKEVDAVILMVGD